MAVIAMQATRATSGMQAANRNDLDRGLMLKMLASGNKETLLRALAQIRRAGEDVELKIQESVARLMGHQEPEVAAAAAGVLGGLGSLGTRYMDQILFMLKHPSAKCRIAAAEALGLFGKASRDANRAVAGCLKDSEVAVRVAALWALEAMDAKEQAEAVIAMLNDSSADVRSAAIETISFFVSISQEVESLFDPEARTQLYSDLIQNPQTRYSGLNSIARLGDKAPAALATEIADAVADKDILIRQAAVAAIGAMPQAMEESSEAMEKLKGLLTSQDAGIRAAAAHALGAVGSTSYASFVFELLTDDAMDESGLALQMGSGARRPPPQLRMPRCAALSALGRMGNGTYAGKIADFLLHTNWEVRVTAAEALAALGPQAKNEVSALMGAVDDDAHPVRSMACRALGVIKDPEALARLVEAFEDPAHSVRVAAVMAVGEFGKLAEDSSHDVFKLLSDSVPAVRAAAARSLSVLGDSTQSYASAIGPMLYDDDPEVRCAILQALTQMGAQGAAFQDEAEERLQDPVKAVRQSAAEALEMMGSTKFLALKDFGRGPGVPLDKGGFEGLGHYYGGIQQKKAELQLSGKWIDGVL